MIVFLVCLCLVIACVGVLYWLDERDTKRRIETDCQYWRHKCTELNVQIAKLGLLLENGWVTTFKHGGLDNWQFKAPDEAFPRYFTEAVEREAELAKIKRLNLPKEGE